MKKMVRAVLFAVMAVFSTAVFAAPCAMPETLAEIEGVYQIGTCGDLYKFAEMVNGGKTSINGMLTADIDLDGSNSKQWTPIGTEEKPYRGIFDGNGHTISRLYFNDRYVNYVGLFGSIGKNAKVQNVGVVDSYILGKNAVGGVVGLNEGGTISNVYNTGAVSGGSGVGGVVGDNDGSVSNVYNTGAVSGADGVGGVVGDNSAGSVSNVYNTGTVSGWSGVGGVVGDNDGTVSNGYYNTDIYTGSAVGECEYENVEGKTTAELASTTLPAGFSGDVWEAGSGEQLVVSNGKLVYKLFGLKNVGSQPEIEYAGFLPNAEGFYEISNAQDLKWFAQLVNGGATDIKGKLTANICLNACGEGESVLNADGTLSADSASFTQWTPIGTSTQKFIGTFDGAGHTISGLYFNDGEANDVGLFGYAGSSSNQATIQNVGVEDSYIRGGQHVGGVVGMLNNGFIGVVYNSGYVSGGDAVGGIVGDGGLENTISNAYNTGVVYGSKKVGGIVGNIGGESLVSGVYNSGTVSGNENVGSLVGLSDDDVGFSFAYFNTDITCANCDDPIEGSLGKTTVELASTTLLRGFFKEIWSAGSGELPVVSDGKLVYKLPRLKNVGSQPEIVFWGPKNDIYEISNAQELKWFAQFVNGGATNINGKLTADICLNACDEGDKPLLEQVAELEAQGELLPESFEQWTPIGNESTTYTGKFDGAGFTISGLYFNDENVDYVGLFGEIDYGAKVQNLGVVDSYVKGKNRVGSVAGMLDGTVENCYNTGSAKGLDYVGGIAGIIFGGTVKNSYNVGSVYGNSYAGGIVGSSYRGAIQNVYNAGPVGGTGNVGGVIGENYDGSEVENAFNTGSVKGESTLYYVGDVVGWNDDAYIGNVYYNKNIDCIACTVEYGEGKTAKELAAGTFLGFDTSVWVVGAVSENVKQDTLFYPYLKVFGPHVYVLDDVKKYTITVAVNDETMGTVTGAGEYEYGTEVEIAATANDGYKFTDWEDDVKTAARTITVTKAETYTANFEAIPSSSSSAKSSSSSAKSSSSEAKSSSNEAKSSSSQKESIIAQAQLPQFSVTASGKMVSIAGARPNSIVNVFDMQGNRVKTVVATSANFTFALPSAGVYIVKNGYTAKRVNVR